jgi:hypothetical protein
MSSTTILAVQLKKQKRVFEYIIDKLDKKGQFEDNSSFLSR